MGQETSGKTMFGVVRRRGAVALVAATCLFAAACSSGQSVIDAGQGGSRDAGTTAPAPDATAPGDGDGSETTATPDANTADGTAPDDTAPDDTGPADTAPDAGGTPATTEPAATTTIASLADQPDCPVDALDDADGPVAITFWHGMANELESALIALTDEYNASQDRVVVTLQNQTSYDSAIDTYIQASQSSRPHLIQLPEYVLQSFAQSGTFIPAESCIQASAFDTSEFLERVVSAYVFEGIQWGMPFNVSNPVLYYNRQMFEAAGLDLDSPPITLDDLRATSQQIVDTGAAAFGTVFDSGADSGGGWYLEQWFGRAGELYADNGNGRFAPATEVLYDNATGVELLTFVQDMVADGLAVNVGDNAGGQDAFLKMIDRDAPGAMAIGTSAALGSVLAALGGGLAPGLTTDDIGVGPMPGPSPEPGAQVGGGSLWVVADKSDAEAAAAWDYITYVTSAQSQSTWASRTGYVPIREDALDLEPLATTYATDPRFSVAYEQLLTRPDDVTANSPVLGPQRQVRVATARAVAAVFGGADVAASLADAAAQSNSLIRSYNERN
jgi:sn-glycerol 3-phosphate transport system substrate-binding protein